MPNSVSINDRLGPGGLDSVGILETDANGNTVLVGADGTVYLTFDSNGNIVAEITPRTDTLANLLLVTDAGVGEIASATDVNAIVKYLGTPSVGKAYYMSKEVGRLNIAYSSLSIATVTPTTCTFLNTLVDDLSVADAANDWFVIPAGVTDMNVFLTVTGVGGAGTYRKIEFEYDVTGGGVWVPFANALDVRANVATIGTSYTCTIQVTSLVSYAGKRVRLRITHDAGSNLTIGELLQATFYNYS